MSALVIDPEAINQYVAQQIVESAIGVKLKEAIDAEIKKVSGSFDNPMRQIVVLAVHNAAREYLETPEIKSKIYEIVSKSLTDEVIEKAASNIRLGY